MKCRQIKTYTSADGRSHKQVVWFNRIITEDVEALTCGETTICSDMISVIDNVRSVIASENYVDGQQAVASSLTQRLSVLKGELWYSVNAGIPLMDKASGKAIIDAYIASIINAHPDVRFIQSFKSQLDGHNYSCTFTVLTVFGELVITV